MHSQPSASGLEAVVIFTRYRLRVGGENGFANCAANPPLVPQLPFRLTPRHQKSPPEIRGPQHGDPQSRAC
jgi:hypothetical protein